MAKMKPKLSKVHRYYQANLLHLANCPKIDGKLFNFSLRLEINFVTILGDSRAKDLIRKMFQKLKRNPKIQVVLRPTQANFPTMAVALVISSKGKINFQTMVVSLNSSKS